MTFENNGTFTWTVPSGVTRVSVVCIGGGGGAGTYLSSGFSATSTQGAGGGGGGALVWANNIPVTPGGTATIRVGAGGRGMNSAGGLSSFTFGSLSITARGGAAGTRAGGTGGMMSVAGAAITDYGGGAGGSGRFQSWTAVLGDMSGGGGGAGGWTGTGGLGSAHDSPGSAGSGGAGGGGYHVSLGGAGGGGGVGLDGEGPPGLEGTATNRAGKGGSSGADGSTAAGGRFGGGAGGLTAASGALEARAGGGGACKLVWGNTGRAFPGNYISTEFTPLDAPYGTNIFTNQRFQYMIGEVGFNVATQRIPGVRVYNIDGFSTTKEQIAEMKNAGLLPICYICVGTWEPYRPDSGLFPQSVIGLPYSIEPFTDERWLDIRSPIVRQLIKSRFEMLARKGCVGVEPDNTNGYSSFEQGFPLTMANWKEYMEWLSDLARSMGMYYGLKNSHEMPRDHPDMVCGTTTKKPVWDFVVDEGCYTRPEGAGSECDPYKLFKPCNKTVFQVMYTYYWDSNFTTTLGGQVSNIVREFRRNICPQQATFSSTSVLKTVDAYWDPFYPCDCAGDIPDQYCA